MKYMNIIKLLSVLLCIGMLFVACDSADGGDDTTANTESGEIVTGETGADETGTGETDAESTDETGVSDDALLDVEAKFENFFQIVEADNGTIGKAERMEGEVVSFYLDGKVFVLKTTDIDTQNNVTDTYTVYNTMVGEVTLTMTNTYFNGTYDALAWNDLMVKENLYLIPNTDGTYTAQKDSKKYPATIMEVTVEEYSDVPYLLVKKAEVVAIDEAVREENPDGCVYEIKTTYSYYDIHGNLVTESNYKLETLYEIESNSTIVIAFGTLAAYFNTDTFELVRTSDYYGEPVSGAFDYENDKYGYSETYGNYVGTLGRVKYMDIYNKTTGETLRYYFDRQYAYSYCYILQNGDVMIMYYNVVDADTPYDFVAENEYLDLCYSILHVADGTETLIEKPAFLVQSLESSEYFEDYANIGDAYNMTLTANARNIAIVYPIDAGVLVQRAEVLVLDNDLSVLYTMDRIIPEQVFSISDLGLKMLENGDYLVKLNGIVADQAIVKADGTIRTYLKNTMSVIGNYIVDDKNIYDYDLNVIYTYVDGEFTVLPHALFGELILTEVSEKDPSYQMMWSVNGTSEEDLVLYDLFEEPVLIESYNNEYAVIKDLKTGRSTLYDSEFNAVLRTYNQMNISEFDGGYLVTTEIEGNFVVYFIK